MRYLVTVTNVASSGRLQLGVLAGAVQDLSGNPNDAFGPATYVVPVDKVDFVDDMEGGLGSWTVTTSVFAQATACAWAWGVPDPSYAAGPSAAYSGTHCWGTVITGDYPNNMDARLISQPIQVGVSPTIDFQVWYNFDVVTNVVYIIGMGWQTNISYNDFGYIEVFDGSAWRNVTSNGPYSVYYGASGGWIHEQIPLDDSTFGSRNIRVRFRATSDATGTSAGTGACFSSALPVWGSLPPQHSRMSVGRWANQPLASSLPDR